MNCFWFKSPLIYSSYWSSCNDGIRGIYDLCVIIATECGPPRPIVPFAVYFKITSAKNEGRSLRLKKEIQS
jgi:hypothetical protein